MSRHRLVSKRGISKQVTHAIRITNKPLDTYVQLVMLYSERKMLKARYILQRVPFPK